MSLFIPLNVFYTYRTSGSVLTGAMAVALYAGRLLGWNEGTFPRWLHCWSSYKKNFVMCVIITIACGALSIYGGWEVP